MPDISQWQFPKNVANQVIGWAPDGKRLINIDPSAVSGLPSPTTALTFLFRNAGNTAYEGLNVFDTRQALGSVTFDTKAVAEAFDPASSPEFLIADNQYYDKTGSEPAHDGKLQITEGTWYVLRKSPLVQLEAFRDDLDIDGVGDSSTGFTKALGMLDELGGGKLVFPRQGQFFGRITDIPSNVEIDFNWSKITPADTLNNAISIVGSKNGTEYGLNTGAAQGDISIAVSGASVNFDAGDDIIIYDNSDRLSDGATGINTEIRRVISKSGASPVTVIFDKPLGFKKDAIVGAGVAKITWKENIKLHRLETAGAVSTGGNAGILARYTKDIEVYDRKHSNGYGTANDFRTCQNVRGGGSRDVDPADVGHYHTGFIQGSRDCLWDGQEDTGVRHSVDFDSADNCRAINIISTGATSTPFVLSHNGAGQDCFVQGEVRNGPDASGGYGFVNTRGWNSVTGEGSGESAWGLIGMGCRIKGRQKRDTGSGADYGVYFQQPMKDFDIDIDAVCGSDTSYDPSASGVSAAVRLYQNSNKGKVRLRRVRGYQAALGSFSASNATSKLNIVEVQMDDVDWVDYAIYADDADGYNIKKLVSGSNINTKLIHFGNASGRPLRHIEFGDIRTSVTAAKTFEGTGTGFDGAASGNIGSIDTPTTINTKSVSANTTISQEEIFCAGKNPIRIDASSAASITSIAAGMFVGQEISIFNAGASNLSLLTTTTNVSLVANIVLGLAPITLIWTAGAWRLKDVRDLTGSATFNPTSLADGAGETTTVTVNGALLGDFAIASFSLDTTGITITAWVSASNTVSVRFQNESGGVLDIASGTLRARVIKV
jgi:hypothetical protein